MPDTIADPLALHYEYSQLSLADLLAARDIYHFHLMNKPNVIGTAVGYYLILNDEPPPEEAALSPRRGRKPKRTFANSSVRDYSWPCVLALVSSWEDETKFGPGEDYQPTQMVPKTLYLPDGQAVPVCVVQADEAPVEQASTAPPDVPPTWKLGGGAPITVSAQGADYTATAGCLVTDGHYTYVLTAAHVCGDEGTPVVSRLRRGEITIGKGSGKQLTRATFSEVYPDFPGRRSLSSLDAGLIRLDNINDWTSNIYGLPALGPLEDVHEHNLSLRLIDRYVVGYGAASGLQRGRIKALFYRYRSVGGFDYIGDFLISPEGTTGTGHGDSGMIWNLDLTQDPKDKPPIPLQSRTLRPLAMQWGGQVFTNGEKQSSFAVATNLSSVCRLFDVELVNDLSRGVSGYWGRVGHYSVAAFAAQIVRSPNLKKLLTSHLGLLSFDVDVLKHGSQLEELLKEKGKRGEFIPLADVPDEVWKKLPPPAKTGRVGGRDRVVPRMGVNGPEHPNHYADIDDPYPATNKSWRDQCLEHPETNLTVQAWLGFYTDIAQHCENEGETELAVQYRNPFKQGLLPFRVWQIFDAMATSVAERDIVGFVSAAGVCAHYVGDGSQPLHGSILADGDPRMTVDRLNDNGEPAKFGEGVHTVYESRMVTTNSDELVTLISNRLPGSHGLRLCQDGKGAALTTVKLMDAVAKILPPRTILKSYESNLDDDPRSSTTKGMWEDLGERTAEVMLRGARTLAMIWDAAWQLGGGLEVDVDELDPITEAQVRQRYIRKSFLPSLTLDEIDSQLE